MSEKMYETRMQAEGRNITLRQQRAVKKWFTMASSTGALEEVAVDVHDEMREDEYRLLNALPGPNGKVSPILDDHITNDPAHPVLPKGKYDMAGNRLWKGKGVPDNQMVHVDPAFFALLEQLRQAQKDKERAARTQAPQNQERQDLAAAAAVAATAALKAMQSETATPVRKQSARE